MDKACVKITCLCTGQNQKVSWWLNVGSTAPKFNMEAMFFSDVHVRKIIQPRPQKFGIPWIPVVTCSECSGCRCTKRWSKKKMA